MIDKVSPMIDVICRFFTLIENYNFSDDYITKIADIITGTERTLREFNISDGNELFSILDECKTLLKLDTTSAIDTDLQHRIASIQRLADYQHSLKNSVNISNIRCAAVSMIKNEGQYLEEWINYGRLVGIDHYYLYDNESDDDTFEILKPYINADIVTLIKWAGKGVQIRLDAFTKAIKDYRYDTEYLAFIDPDEFILPMEYGKSVPDIIDEIMTEYRSKEFRGGTDCGGVGINWLIYGTGFCDKRQDDLVISSYLYHSEHDYAQNCHIKTICDPRAAKGFSVNPHAVDYNPGYTSISEKGSYLFNSPYFYDASYSRLRINHYYYKSREEFCSKFDRNFHGDNPELDDIDYKDSALFKKRYAEADEICNRIYDDKIAIYADDVRQMIAEMHNY